MLKTWRNNFEWEGGGRSVFYLTDLWLQRFEATKVVFSWERLNIFVTGCSIAGDRDVLSNTEENHDDHGSIKTLREVYQGTHFEFNRFSKDEVQRRLKITTPTSPVGGTPEHHLNSLRNWPVELHRRKWISTTAVWSWGNGLVLGKWESARQCLKKVTDSRWRTIVPSRPLTVNKTF